MPFHPLGHPHLVYPKLVNHLIKGSEEGVEEAHDLLRVDLEFSWNSVGIQLEFS